MTLNTLATFVASFAVFAIMFCKAKWAYSIIASITDIPAPSRCVLFIAALTGDE
jgi:hypothetical protein